MKKILFLQSEADWERYGFDDEIYQIDFLNGRYKIGKNKLVDYELVITTVYHDLLANHILAKCHLYGIKTAYFMDGIFDLSNSLNNGITKRLSLYPLFPVHTDIVCVCSEMGVELVESSGATPIRYLPSFANEKVTSVMNKEYMLITTANNPCFSNIEYRVLSKLIRETLELAIESQRKVKIRLYDKKILEEISDLIDKHCIKNDISSSLTKCLEDTSIVFTTHSTVAITCCKMLIPTCCFIYKREPQEPLYGWVHYQGLNLEETVSQMESDCSKQLDYQRKLVSKFDTIKLSEIVEQSYSNRINEFYSYNAKLLLDSSFNYNFIYFLQRLYKKVKSKKIVRYLRTKLMMR